MAVVAALRAMEAGVATEAQQREAFAWIVNYAARMQSLSYDGGGPEATAFNEGRRFVGVQIQYLTRAGMDQIREEYELRIAHEERARARSEEELKKYDKR
jgi:hypothetical protein